MRKFDTRVQYIKYKIIREIAKLAWEDSIDEKLINISNIISPYESPTMRSTIDKERNIIKEQSKLITDKNKKNKDIIEVIDIACERCPSNGYTVTENCRSCVARCCGSVCPRGAFLFDKNRKAIIDKEKCVECGRCADSCPFNAIINHKRPCEKACKVGAITRKENGSAEIDNQKCISCGACVYRCPWGAIVDKSYILDIIYAIKNSNENSKYKVYAIVAPSISSQFGYARLGQVICGIKKLGFYKIIEAALGADIVALKESKELVEKGFLMSSCCPAFVDYVKKQFPNLVKHISTNPSPAVTTAMCIKKVDLTACIVFIGPCTAKKMEFQKTGVIDICITFEELQALFDSKNIDLAKLEDEVLNDASYYGRVFARSGGLTESVIQGIKENEINNFELKPIACNGIEECKKALFKLSKNVLDANFIEGMACAGGCIGGAGCLTHRDRDKKLVDDHSKKAQKKNIKDAAKKIL
ncbi:MAG: monomeric [FeFe] hydrogenase [Clostridiales bacterium]|nr:monomeric [FeFe] hydrogenase [Clostridiales bacterium]